MTIYSRQLTIVSMVTSLRARSSNRRPPPDRPGRCRRPPLDGAYHRRDLLLDLTISECGLTAGQPQADWLARRGVGGTAAADQRAARSGFGHHHWRRLRLPLPAPVVGDASASSCCRRSPRSRQAPCCIIDHVLGSGFEVVNAKMTSCRPNAGEFMEVYKGVVPECVDWVEELVSGKVVAMQLRFKPESTVLARASAARVRSLTSTRSPFVPSARLRSRMPSTALTARTGHSRSTTSSASSREAREESGPCPVT